MDENIRRCGITLYHKRTQRTQPSSMSFIKSERLSDCTAVNVLFIMYVLYTCWAIDIFSCRSEFSLIFHRIHVTIIIFYLVCKQKVIVHISSTHCRYRIIRIIWWRFAIGWKMNWMLPFNSDWTLSHHQSLFHIDLLGGAEQMDQILKRIEFRYIFREFLAKVREQKQNYLLRIFFIGISHNSNLVCCCSA